MRPVPIPELELLLRFTWRQVDAEGIRRIAELAARDLDWDRLALVARLHGLVPLLHRTLSGLASSRVPQAVLARLKSQSEAIRFQNLVLAQELLAALRVLESAGVTAMPYKGPALAVFLYQDIALRQFSDIDLLVRPRDAVKAKRILMRLGYVPYRALSDRWDAAWVRIHQEFLLVVPHKQFFVDLSWCFAPAIWRLPKIADPTWRRLGRLSLLGASVPWPDAEDLLLILCLHGSKHKWEELKWIVDVAELLRTRPELDWRRLTDDARRMGAYRMLAICLVLASELLDAPIPRELLDRFRSTPSVASLAAEVCDDLCASTAKPAGITDRLSHIQGRLSFLARAADRSTMRWACRALHFGYFVLYRMVRPGIALMRRSLAP